MPVWTSRNVVMHRPFAALVSAAALTVPAAAPMPSAERFAMLFQNDFTPNVDSAIGDFTSADFSGYALSPGLGGTGHPFGTQGIGCTFAATFVSNPATPFVPNVVFGYAWVDSLSADWYFAERFDEPISVTVAGMQIFLHTGFDIPFYPNPFPS